jgi:hypothetical protein
MKDEKLEWFGGNEAALAMYYLFVELAHIWDDLIDKDKPVSDDAINKAFLICLVYLPSNPFYQYIQKDILPMWITIVSAYQAANSFEKQKDEFGMEIGHVLRFAAANILTYAVYVCVGPEKSKDIVPAVWKEIVNERYDEYQKGVLDATQ